MFKFFKKKAETGESGTVIHPKVATPPAKASGVKVTPVKTTTPHVQVDSQQKNPAQKEASVKTKEPVKAPEAKPEKTESTSTPASSELTQLAKDLTRGPEVPIIDFVDHILEHAQGMRASDIHFDPQTSNVRLRMRIDGILTDIGLFPKSMHDEVVSRIKILANMRTDEHQVAQDGRFRTLLAGNTPVDVRVSIAPTYYGENAVLRLLADRAEEFSLTSLGFSATDQEKLNRAIKRPFGMIVATGPTGSGKTTTLYTLVKMLNNPDRSIITIEDPIEYAIDGIVQIQANPQTGLSFANGLRSILRQDPNIIMVGEIRDAETAGIAVNTALTGHLLLSTLHTNDAATLLPRLLDLKIESYLIASTLAASIGQRLVRKICKHCKVERTVTPAEQKALESVGAKTQFGVGTKVYSGKGCAECNQTGFNGRIGIYEVLVMDKDMREAILRKASATEIKNLAIQNGMTTMFEDGLLKAKAGLTTIEEVLRTLHE